MADQPATAATVEQLQATILDGWRLGCGCLYLHITGQPRNASTFVTLTVGTTNPHLCREFHNVG